MGRSTLFYGLSSELLRLSSRVPGRDGAYFVDEVLGVAYRASDVARSPQQDSLTPVASLDGALSSSSEVVFAPRYRSIEDPGPRLQEIRSHLEVLAPHLGDRTLINALPVGPGENSQIEEFIADRTGRPPRYVYAPVGPDGSVRYIGVRRGDAPGWLVEATGGEVMDVEDAEAAHIDWALSSAMPRLVRGVVARGPPVGYLRDAFAGVLEAFLVGAGADPGSSAHSVYSLVRRAFDEYSKRLTSSLKESIRGIGMRMSRARIAILWTLDEGSLRGEEPWAFGRLREALASTFVDLSHTRSDRLLQLEGRDVALVCTRRDEEALSARRFEGRLVVRVLYPRPEISGRQAAPQS
jgi:hypothetical protein